MSLMLGKLYHALRSAQGVTDAQALAAAEEVAGYEKAMNDLKLEVRIGSAVLALNTAVLLGLVWTVVRLVETVARLQP